MPFDKPSQWIKAISEPGNLRLVILEATAVAAETAALHALMGEPARAMGELMVGAWMVASYCKPGERVNLNIQGNGVAAQALADAYPDGALRAYLIPRDGWKGPQPEAAPGLWGHGVISILRTKGEEGLRPYMGAVPLATGEFDRDFAGYWATSEQVATALGIRVETAGGAVSEAGGVLLQALGGASPEEVALVRRHSETLRARARELIESPDPLHLAGELLDGIRFREVERRGLRFECNCSWDRVQRALALAGESELHSMLEQDSGAVVHCDFCTKDYQIDRETLEKLIGSAKR